MKCDGCIHNVNNYCEKYKEKCSDKRVTVGMCKEIRYNSFDKITMIFVIIALTFYLIEKFLL